MRPLSRKLRYFTSPTGSSLFSRTAVAFDFSAQQQRGSRTSVAGRTSLSSTSLMLASSPADILAAATSSPVKYIATPMLGMLATIVYFKYNRAIRKRVKQLQSESWIFGAGVTMERADQSSSTSSNFRLLELSPEFLAEIPSAISLGTYLSSLRPKQMPDSMSMDDLPNRIKQEIEAGLASALVQTLGPNLGRALLPAVGIGPIQGRAKKLASAIASKWFLSDDMSISQSGDKAGFPVSLLSLLAVSEMNAKVSRGDFLDGDGDQQARDQPNDMAKRFGESDNVEALPGLSLSAMEKMSQGEAVIGASFVDEEGLKWFPQDNRPFVMEEHFDHIVLEMESRLLDQYDCPSESTEMKMAKQDIAIDGEEDTDLKNTSKEDDDRSCYDPEDRRFPHPTPINERLFPDLHLGWGDAICSHTKREILKMRVLSLLLNRLGANYYRQMKGDADLFAIKMKASDEDTITSPSALVQALIDSGHQVSVVPTSRLTTFGIGLCVKESDGCFTQVPLGVFIESGYEDASGLMAPAMMPHSGLDMFVTGPLTGHRANGKPSTLHIQHFIGIEGFCGWKNHAIPELPFNDAVQNEIPLTGVDAVRAVRLAGLYANMLNGVATEMALPFGGYGATAVCNDSAAILQQVLYGRNTIYPLTSIGKYMQRTLRYAQRMQKALSAFDGMDAECKDIGAIVDAMKVLPNDINATPGKALDAARRLLHTLQPREPFVLMKESRRVMESIIREEEMMSERLSSRYLNQ